MKIDHKQYDSKRCYEVRIGDVYIGFSYNTPVSLHDAGPNGRTLETDEHYSRTTDRHKRLLLSKADRVSQDELEREIEFALARQALRTLRERLNYGYTGARTTDQSPDWADSGSTVLWGAGTAAEAG